MAVDVVTAAGELVRADAEHQPRPLLGRPRCRSGLPRHRHPLPPADLPAAGRDVAGHVDLPPRRRRAGRALAARRAARCSTGASSRCWRRPGCRTSRCTTGVEHPGGTVLLLHTTCMADSDDGGAAADRRAGRVPVLGRELGHVSGPTSVAEENLAQTDQNPEGHRYAVDCAWSDAPADVLAPLLLDIWRGLDTPHSFSIWYGWAPDRATARHGVLGRGQRLRRDVPHLHRRGRRRALPLARSTSARRRSRATAAWASTSATPTSPGAPTGS